VQYGLDTFAFGDKREDLKQSIHFIVCVQVSELCRRVGGQPLRFPTVRRTMCSVPADMIVNSAAASIARRAVGESSAPTTITLNTTMLLAMGIAPNCGISGDRRPRCIEDGSGSFAAAPSFCVPTRLCPRPIILCGGSGIFARRTH
jgi:hypothetical protein